MADIEGELSLGDRGAASGSEARVNVLIIGSLAVFSSLRNRLSEGADLSISQVDDPEGLLDVLPRHETGLMVLDLVACRKRLRRLAALVRSLRLAPRRVILVTPEGPAPELADLARQIPGAQLVMGQHRLEERVAEAVASALSANLRQAPRTTALGPAEVVLEDGTNSSGELVNLSESGVLISMKHSVATGAQVRVRFTLAGQELDLMAICVRPGGFRFQAAPASLRSLIAEAMAMPRTAPDQATELPQEPVLRLIDASCRLAGCEVLQPLTLSLRRGERVALIGPSGGGKTTLLRLMGMAIEPSAGEVHAFGVLAKTVHGRRLRALQCRVATIHQHLELIPQASVLHNVIAGRLGRMSLARAALALVSRKEAQKVEKVLDQVGIVSKIYERVDALSGGERQRVAIARALYQEPDVILADEPLASVDPARAAEIVDLLVQASAEKTMVVSTHQLEPVLPYVSRVIGLRMGRVLFDKPASKLEIEDLARLYESSRALRTSSPAPDASPVPAAPIEVLNIAASNTPGENILPIAVVEFLRDWPGLKVNLAVSQSTRALEDLVSRRIDLAFVGMRVPRADLQFEEFAEDEIILVAAPSFSGIWNGAVVPSLAARLPRVDREAGSGTRATVEDHFVNLGVPLDPSAVVLEAGNQPMLKLAVETGLGVAFVPRVSVRTELNEGRLREVPIDMLKIPRRVFAVWRRDVVLSPAARKFLEVARNAWSRQK
jgi:phosphonate transport system ATP-binding protein